MSITAERKKELISEYGAKEADTGSPDVQASVSARCRLDSGRRICYEEIRLRAAGRTRVRSTHG